VPSSDWRTPKDRGQDGHQKTVGVGLATHTPLWLVLVRECPCFAIWLASYRSTRVSWRERDFVIADGGTLRPCALPAAIASSGS